MPTLLHRFRAWLAQVLAVEPGRPNDGLVELSAGTERDKPWHELSREFSDALEAWRFNPLARRIIGLVTAYVIGDGLTLRSPRARVNAFLHTLQRDPENNLMIEQAEWCDELTRSGEIFLALFARIDGTVVVRAVPASRIERIDWEPGDYRAETLYYEVRDPGSLEDRVWHSPRAARAAGLRSGDKPLSIMLHYAVNRPVGCVRGESDLRPILEWLRRYSRWLEDRVSLNAAARAFVWVVRVPGRLVEAKAAQYKRPPAAGSVIVVDRDAEDWEAKAPGLNARDAASDGRAIRWMVAAGGPGIGLADFGEAEGANLATAEAMGEQRRRFLRRRQKLFGHILADLAVQGWNWTVDLGLRRGPLISEADVVVDLPDVAPADNQALASAAREITLAIGELRTLTGPSTALRTLALRLMLKFAGESIPEQDFEQIVAGGEERGARNDE